MPGGLPLGTAGDLVVISVTEGDDMVRKHPKIFTQTDVVAVNKVDLAGFVGVDPMVLVDDYRRLNPQGKVVLTDARSGRGWTSSSPPSASSARVLARRCPPRRAHGVPPRAPGGRAGEGSPRAERELLILSEEALAEAWRILTDGTEVAGSELRIEGSR